MNAATALDHAIACARAALPLADEIEAVEGKINAMNAELATLTDRITVARSTFVFERANAIAERRQRTAKQDTSSAERADVLRDLEAKVAEAKATLVAVQNDIAKQRKTAEKIASLFRKLDRMQEHPSSGAAGRDGVIAEIIKLL